MKKTLSLLLALLLVVLAFGAFTGCSKRTEISGPAILTEWQSTYTAGAFGIRNKQDPFVELTLSTGDTIRLELYPNVAPIAVENFTKYVEDGFYDGVIFHRIIKNFMIQTGGFEEKEVTLESGEKETRLSQKTPTYPAIKGEFSANGVRNDLSHTRGVLSMARVGKTPPETSKQFNSATSQFFICSEITEGQTSSLNGNYAAFGCVIDEESMEVVSKLEKVETTSKDLYYGDNGQSSNDVPVETIKIIKATLYKA